MQAEHGMAEALKSGDKRWEDRSWTSGDGLKLHFRDYAGSTARPPILCFHGLTRNARDFEALAGRLAGEWRVLCPDMRGRGDSDYARDPMTYTPAHYVADVEAGTVKPLEDTDGRAGELRSSRAPFIRGVDFAVALEPADKAFSGLFD